MTKKSVGFTLEQFEELESAMREGGYLLGRGRGSQRAAFILEAVREKRARAEKNGARRAKKGVELNGKKKGVTS